MNNKTKSFFSKALIAIILLSLFPVAAPAMAENTTDAKAFCETPTYDCEGYQKSKVTDRGPISGCTCSIPKSSHLFGWW